MNANLFKWRIYAEMRNINVAGLSETELEFYSRQIALSEIGYEGQLKLTKSSVCIAGLGGLGSPIALQLAAMGVGHIRLVDQDVVELSNLHRQILYGANFVGYPKVEVAAKRLKELNPHIEVEPLPVSINAKNAEDIVKGMDVIVDGLDRMTPRYAINRACRKNGVPYVFAAALMTFGNITTILPGKTPCLECFQGDINDEDLPTCASVGVHTSLLSIMAGIETSEAIRIMLGKEPLLAKKLLHCDVKDLTFEEIEISKSENCPVCGLKPLRPPMPLTRKAISEAHGRGRGKVFRIIPREDLKLNMNELISMIAEVGFKIKVKAELGVTFDNEFGGSTSILKSGIAVIEGARDEAEAYKSFSKLIVDGLGISESKIL
ncbi:HesA/MoeB/ThiF family protein [Candidatus Bathyarchaeota archaeon]|nr:HesA/MoeB/ThiF family protein [Candidatus Bathyarchaeota archaeon]